MNKPATQYIQDQVKHALHEDIGSGDVTAHLIPADKTVQAQLVCREAAVICGCDWVSTTFQLLDPSISIEWQVKDGDSVPANTVLCNMSGNARHILSGERVALNFLQTLSATATLTAKYVQAVSATDTRILDTRKTIPGLRLAQKYAVLCGGGVNHRIGLYDMILIKENHITAAGSIAQAVQQARQESNLLIEVEVENLEELQQAIAAGVDRILLDNMDLETLREAVNITRQRVPLEASGGVNLQTVAAIAAIGVDYISVGELTKNVDAVDLSLRFSVSQ